jgi:predicted nucleic acid-binding protein
MIESVFDSNVFTRGLISKILHDLLCLNLIPDGDLNSVYTQAILNEVKNVFNRQEVNYIKTTKEHRDLLAEVINASKPIEPNRAELIHVHRYFGSSLDLRYGSYVIAAAYHAFKSEKPCMLVTNDGDLIRMETNLVNFGVEVLTPLKLLVTKFDYKPNDE